jgi:hypothetical protein
MHPPSPPFPAGKTHVLFPMPGMVFLAQEERENLAPRDDSRGRPLRLPAHSVHPCESDPPCESRRSCASCASWLRNALTRIHPIHPTRGSCPWPPFSCSSDLLDYPFYPVHPCELRGQIDASRQPLTMAYFYCAFFQNHYINVLNIKIVFPCFTKKALPLVKAIDNTKIWR